MSGTLTQERPRAVVETAVVWRLRLLGGVLLLAAVAFRQAGGLIVPDTKLDLTANPGAFLGRALHMWDPTGAFGQVQNQAYGYLFPTGPFHWGLISAGVPEWVVQRLWWTTILSVGFLGVWRLSGAMGIGTPWARYLGALLYAVGPRFLSEVAVTSVEVWPMAVAPWVVLPLVVPGPRTWRWRITRSALAFAAVGGVNAVASGAALVLPTLWFATRKPAREAALHFGAWLAAVVAVSIWWLVPLALLGRYSPPFLDWIENAPVTTAFASPFEAVRGTTPWLNYLSGPAGPAWPAGWQFVTLPTLVFATASLAAAGLVGVRLAPRRHRSFLALSLLVGLLLVTAGHTGAASSPIAEQVQHLLDGPLAPLRNTHKFELVVRLPLTIGLIVTLTRLARGIPRLGLAPWLSPVAAVSCVALLAAPAVNGGLARPEGYQALPGYWRDAATWLDAHDEPGTVLVVPAAGFADFVWGSTKDDPLQALSEGAFAVRDAVPLGSAGTTRWLDAVERSLQSGTGGAGLRAALVSAGIRHVVLRNDLRADAVDSSGGQSLRVHESIAASGLDRVATFGPAIGAPPGMPPESAVDTVDQRTRLPYPAIEVYAVGDPHAATVVTAPAIVVVDGGPEDVPDVLGAVPGAMAAIVGSDRAAVPDELITGSVTVLTDGNRDREVFFGRASNNTSSVLSADAERRTGRSVDDYVSDPMAPETTRRGTGDLAGLTASSSASDANASLRLGPGFGPQAAVDGDQETAWVSGAYGSAVGEWIELELTNPSDVTGLTVSLESLPRRVSTPGEVRVDTDTGSATSRLLPGVGPQRVAVPVGATGTVRVTVTESVEGESANGVAIAEIAVPTLDLGTRLVVPAGSGQGPQVVLARRADEGRRECAWVVDRPLCTGSSGRQAESEGGLRRSLTLSEDLSAAMSGEAAARAGDAVERLLAGLTSVEVTASSRSVREPFGRPAAAMDGDLGSGWVASPDDEDPTLTIDLSRTVRTDRLQLQRDAYLAASVPTRVEVVLDDGRPMDLEVDAEGYLRWPEQSVRTVALRFTEISPLRSTDSATGFVQEMPVGVSEVLVPGVDPRGALTPASRTGAPCGFGPDLVVGERTYPTSVTGTVADILQGRTLRWSTCEADGVMLPAGQVVLEGAMSLEFVPRSLTLTQSATANTGGGGGMSPGGESYTPVGVTRQLPTSLRAQVPASAEQTLLVVPQNHNSGWVARDADGTDLTAVRVNGWQQGWVVPPGGARSIDAEFAPDGAYRLGLGLGALLVLGMVAAAVVPSGQRVRAALASRPVRPLVWNALMLAGLIMLAGAVGGVAAASSLAAVAVLRSRRAEVVVAAVAVVTGSVLVIAAGPWPGSRAAVDDLVVQLLVLVAVALTLVSSDPLTGARSLRRPQRMSGRSTT
jgi:arabinofuranan 3-O-arabinosyltransferase